MAKYVLDRVLRKRTRTANLIFFFSVVFNILVEPHAGGLRTGKDGINTVGRMTNGQGKSDRQHRLVFKKKSFLPSRNWVNTASKSPASRCCRQEPKDLTAILSYFLTCVSRPVRSNSLNATWSVHRTTSPDAHTGTFFSCEHRTASSAHFQCGHITLAQGEIGVCVIHSVSHPSHSLMSLFNVPYRPFSPVLSSPTAQSSRPSASTSATAQPHSLAGVSLAEWQIQPQAHDLGVTFARYSSFTCSVCTACG